MNSAKANRSLLFAALTLFWCTSLFCAEYVADYKLPVNHPTSVGELLESSPTLFLQANNNYERVASSRTRLNGSTLFLASRIDNHPNVYFTFTQALFREWRNNAIHSSNLKKILYPFHEFI